MIPRAAAELFAAAARDPVHSYRITMSYIQVGGWIAQGSARGSYTGVAVCYLPALTWAGVWRTCLICVHTQGRHHFHSHLFRLPRGPIASRPDLHGDDPGPAQPHGRQPAHPRGGGPGRRRFRGGRRRGAGDQPGGVPALPGAGGAEQARKRTAGERRKAPAVQKRRWTRLDASLP